MSYDIVIGRDDADKKRFGEKGLIFLGKGYVKMGNYTSLSNRILLDVARSHVILVAGKRGSGKSYSLGAIAEELANLKGEERENIGSLIFDTMGIFWTMKFKNEKEKELMGEWGIKAKNLPCKVFVPFGYFEKYEEKGIPVDKPFALQVSEIGIEDWLITFNLSLIDPIAVVIERVLGSLEGDYDLDKIIEEIGKIPGSAEVKEAARSLFYAAKTWGIFAGKGEKATAVTDLITAGTTSILDLSPYNSVGVFNIRALVIGLICRKLFQERMNERKREEVEAVHHGADYLSFKQERGVPLIWLFIDEVHEFIGKGEKTAATDALIQLLREGRQPGISLVMATQQPGALHRDALTQSDIVISHRVTAKPDLEGLNEMMQSYLLDSIKKYLDDLPNLKGSAIILDDNSERIYPMRVRPRFTWHGGEAPTAVKMEKRI